MGNNGRLKGSWDRYQGHGDRYLGSLFRVDEPVPDDFAWASESIEFGSAFVSIYGRSSSCALFLTA